ncbi:hypothetical protein BS17DRAFT_811842 [Gyrodon lividus]|nr:hypothetical protein BS17DRAFT_811842 [Gyrodon lividus]
MPPSGANVVGVVLDYDNADITEILAAGLVDESPVALMFCLPLRNPDDLRKRKQIDGQN